MKVTRRGDYYESYGRDAVVLARILGIALCTVSKHDRTPLAFFPAYALSRHFETLCLARFTIETKEHAHGTDQHR